MKNKTYADVLAFLLKNKGKVIMSNRDIAKQINYSYSTINRAIKYLESINIIKVYTDVNTTSIISYIGNKDVMDLLEISDKIDSLYDVLYSLMNNTSK